MSRRKWFALLIFYISYLLVGAIVFQALESYESQEEKLEHAKKRVKVQETTLDTIANLPDDERHRTNLLWSLLAADELGFCSILPYGYNITNETSSLELLTIAANITNEELYAQDEWNLWNSFFFTFITVTTIGYGHMAPRTMYGQQFCIFYSLFGIPLNTVVFVTLAGFYSEYVLTESDRKGGKGRSTLSLLFRAFLYLFPGLLLFMIIPALFIMFVEEWTFGQSFYFAFCTLTTIGFGDYVAGYRSSRAEGAWEYIYKGYIMLWTMFGLSYLIMVITFLIDAYKSEKIREMEEKTARLFKKKTAKLQHLLHAFMLQHHAKHHHSSSTNYVCSAVESPHSGCSETHDDVFMQSCNGAQSNRTDQGDDVHLMISNTPYKRKGSSLRRLRSLFSRKLSDSERRILPRTSAKRSVVYDVKSPSCTEMQTLADLVAAVGDLVEVVEQYENKESMCTFAVESSNEEIDDGTKQVSQE